MEYELPLSTCPGVRQHCVTEVTAQNFLCGDIKQEMPEAVQDNPGVGRIACLTCSPSIFSVVSGFLLRVCARS